MGGREAQAGILEIASSAKRHVSFEFPVMGEYSNVTHGGGEDSSQRDRQCYYYDLANSAAAT